MHTKDLSSHTLTSAAYAPLWPKAQRLTQIADSPDKQRLPRVISQALAPLI
jgi:hypothetical protein